MLQQQRRMLWATAVCFTVGLLAGTVVLWGGTRPFRGDGPVLVSGGVLMPVAVVAGIQAARPDPEPAVTISSSSGARMLS